MKSATIFLVAVTVFTTLVPESSTTTVAPSSGWQVLENIAGKVADGVDAAVGKVGDILKGALDIGSLKQAIDKALEVVDQTVPGKVDEELKEKVYTGIENSENDLSELIAYVEKAVPKTVGNENQVLTKILVEFRLIEGVTAIIHPSIKLAVNSGSDLALKINADIIKAVIEQTEVQLDGMIKTLEQTPGKVAAGVETQVQNLGGAIVARAECVLEAIYTSLNERGVIKA